MSSVLYHLRPTYRYTTLEAAIAYLTSVNPASIIVIGSDSEFTLRRIGPTWTPAQARRKLLSGLRSH